MSDVTQRSPLPYDIIFKTQITLVKCRHNTHIRLAPIGCTKGQIVFRKCLRSVKTTWSHLVIHTCATKTKDSPWPILGLWIILPNFKSSNYDSSLILNDNLESDDWLSGWWLSTKLNIRLRNYHHKTFHPTKFHCTAEARSWTWKLPILYRKIPRI